MFGTPAPRFANHDEMLKSLRVLWVKHGGGFPCLLALITVCCSQLALEGSTPVFCRLNELCIIYFHACSFTRRSCFLRVLPFSDIIATTLKRSPRLVCFASLFIVASQVHAGTREGPRKGQCRAFPRVLAQVSCVELHAFLYIGGKPLCRMYAIPPREQTDQASPRVHRVRVDFPRRVVCGWRVTCLCIAADGRSCFQAVGCATVAAAAVLSYLCGCSIAWGMCTRFLAVLCSCILVSPQRPMPR